MEIKADENGELIVTVLGEQEIYGGFPKVSRWAETDPSVFRRIDKERYMAFQENEEGEITSLASGSGYHGSFVKIPWYESNRIQLYLMILYMAVFLVSALICAIKFIKGERNLLQIGGVLSLLFITGLCGAIYTLFLHRIAGFPAFAFGVSLPAKIMLTLLLLISISSIGFLIVFIKHWRAGKIKTFDKAFYSVTTITYLGAIYWLHYWNLLGYRF